MSDNMFNLILTILLLYFVVNYKCIYIYISIVKMVILNDDGVTGRRLLAK